MPDLLHHVLIVYLKLRLLLVQRSQVFLETVDYLVDPRCLPQHLEALLEFPYLVQVLPVVARKGLC